MILHAFPLKRIVGLLFILLLLFFWFGHLKGEREVGIENAQGSDQLSRILFVENEEFRRVNELQQRGTLIVAGVVVLVASIGWIRPSGRESGADSE